MKSIHPFFFCLLPVYPGIAKDETKLPRQSVEALVEASCIDCHDSGTKTALNFDELSFDLADADAFRMWEKVYDRIESGEMPPKKKPRPDPKLKNDALASLHRHLRHTSLAQQKQDGRTPARRLTRTEYEYTLHDLLGIGGDLSSVLPPENVSAHFNTVAGDQGISPVHLRAYLAAADAAIDEALQLGPKPNSEPRVIDYRNHSYVRMWFERELRHGGNTVKRTDDAFVTYDPRPHTTRTDNMNVRFPVAGRYRIEAEAYAYQLGYVTRFPSLSLSSDGPMSQSYTASGVMIPAMDRPSEVFAKLFLQGRPEEVKRERQKLSDGRSILDALGEKRNRLLGSASPMDREKLDAYFEAVRQAERDITEAEAWFDRPRPKVDAETPQDIADKADLVGRIELLFQLVPLPNANFHKVLNWCRSRKF